MSTLAIINSVQTLKRYKKVGYTQEQAEEQVEILQEAAEEIFRKIKEDNENTKTLTEGKFLYEIEKLKAETKLEIEKLRNETEKMRGDLIEKIKNSEIKIMTIIGSTFLILVGILAKGFHWY